MEDCIIRAVIAWVFSERISNCQNTHGRRILVPLTLDEASVCGRLKISRDRGKTVAPIGKDSRVSQ
jgi:hypothetical protein